MPLLSACNPGNPGTERYPVLTSPHPQDPLESIQPNVKFTPRCPASQRAVDSNWRATDSEGGIFTTDSPQSGARPRRVRLNQQGRSPEGPLFPFLQSFSLHGLPLVCMKREMHPPFSLHLQNLFSFRLGPTVLVQNHTLSLPQIEETMPR